MPGIQGEGGDREEAGEGQEEGTWEERQHDGGVWPSGEDDQTEQEGAAEGAQVQLSNPDQDKPRQPRHLLLLLWGVPPLRHALSSPLPLPAWEQYQGNTQLRTILQLPQG